MGSADIVAVVPTHECGACGKKFQPRSFKQLFCSLTCAHAYQAHAFQEAKPENGLPAPETRECGNCHQRFTPVVPNQLFCSVDCGMGYRGSLNQVQPVLSQVAGGSPPDSSSGVSAGVRRKSGSTGRRVRAVLVGATLLGLATSTGLLAWSYSWDQGQIAKADRMIYADEATIAQMRSDLRTAQTAEAQQKAQISQLQGQLADANTRAEQAQAQVRDLSAQLQQAGSAEAALQQQAQYAQQQAAEAQQQAQNAANQHSLSSGIGCVVTSLFGIPICH